MSNEETVSFLQQTMRLSPMDSAYNGLADVAKELGYLPVALAQAGAYMQQNRCSPEEYLRVFSQSRKDLLEYKGYGQERHKANAYAAFDVSFQKLPQAVQDFLCIVSHYHFASFPMFAFAHAAKSEFLSDPYPFTDRDSLFDESISLLKSIFFTNGEWAIQAQHLIIRTLQSHSIASFTPGFRTDLLQLHPLFHDWLFDQIPSFRRPMLLQVRIIACGQGERWLEHYFVPAIRHLQPYYEMNGLHINDKTILGRILREMEYLDDAQKLFLEVYQALKQREGDQDIHIADVTTELAWTYEYRNVPKTEELLKQAVKTYEAALGPHNAKTQFTTVWLADTYRQLKNHEAFEDLQSKISQWGQEHSEERDYIPTEGTRWIATYYFFQRRYSDAEILFNKLLARQMTALGENHLDTVRSMFELACTYRQQNRFSEAEELHKKVLKRRKETLGEKHPDTLESMSNLVWIYCDLRRFSEANHLCTMLVSSSIRALGEEHPDTLQSKYCLASIFRCHMRKMCHGLLEPLSKS
jgi:tetratricopeptide (TPR) repeat protein